MTGDGAGHEISDPPTGDAPQPAAALSPELDAKLNAAIDLVRRCGAHEVMVGYADDVKPPLWWAWAEFRTDAAGRPRPAELATDKRHEAAAAMHPVRAVLRLAEQLVDGSTCAHCGRPAGLDPDEVNDMPAGALICWYQWDPELRTYRRACEGGLPTDRVARHGAPYTRHGHLVLGFSADGWPEPEAKARCGGPLICPKCATDAQRLLRRETGQ